LQTQFPVGGFFFLNSRQKSESETRPHSSPDSPCGRENSVSVLPNPNPQKNSLAKPSPIEAPPPARRIGGRVPQKMFSYFLEEKIRPSPNQKSGEHFCGTRERSERWWGYSFVSDFENRCELGKIETPREKLTHFLVLL